MRSTRHVIRVQSLLYMLLLFLLFVAEGRRVSKPTAAAEPAVAKAAPAATQKKPKFEFRGPELNQEEASSTNLPKHMRCDACSGVAHQIASEFQKLLNHGKGYVPKKGSFKGQTRLRESDYLEAIERVCDGWKTKDDHPLKDFGVKSIAGVNKLSGPGTPAGNENGVLIGGMQWVRKVSEFCGRLVEEHGEDEIYNAYASATTTVAPLKSALCGDYCTSDDRPREL